MRWTGSGQAHASAPPQPWRRTHHRPPPESAWAPKQGAEAAFPAGVRQDGVLGVFYSLGSRRASQRRGLLRGAAEKWAERRVALRALRTGRSDPGAGLGLQTWLIALIRTGPGTLETPRTQKQSLIPRDLETPKCS